LSAGRQRKKSRFFKIFSKNPKVLRIGAVNDYMNGGSASGKRQVFLNIFQKSPKVPAEAAVI
jgi:hypothetical protein